MVESSVVLLEDVDAIRVSGLCDSIHDDFGPADTNRDGIFDSGGYSS